MTQANFRAGAAKASRSADGGYLGRGDDHCRLSLCRRPKNAGCGERWPAVFSPLRTKWSGGTRKGKLLLNTDKPAAAALIVPAEGDHVAVIGENRKLLIIPLEQLPEMPRGKGVRLQKYRDGGISDAKVFSLKDGLTWKDSAGRTFTVGPRELRDWLGNRAEAGRLPPKGFPKNNRFG